MRTLGIIALGFVLTMLAIIVWTNDAGASIEIGLLH